MKLSATSRREFLAVTAAMAAMSVAGCAASGGARKGGVERRKFGATGMEVAVLGFGGAEIGYEQATPETVNQLLNAALDAGLNTIDTAECYRESEVLIGDAIAHRRRDFLLFTKCGHTAEAPAKGPDWSKDGVVKSVERSLKRLRTDAVDLVLLHSCVLDELKKGDCIAGLEEAKKQGKTRFIGYSGDGQAAKWAIESGRFDALETSINLCDQQALNMTLPLARERNMGVIAKRPIANAVWRYDAKPENGYHQEYWRRLQQLGYEFAMGESRKDTSPDGPAGIALRFTAMQPGVHVLIVGTTKPQRWAENAALLAAGPLDKKLYDSIRTRWFAIAGQDWVGQT